MGIIQHRSIVATGFCCDNKKEGIIKRQVDNLRKKLEKEDVVADTIIMGPHKGINGYITYVFCPDGSKLGWEPHEIAEEYREKFLDIFNKDDCYFDIVDTKCGELIDGIEVEYCNSEEFIHGQIKGKNASEM